MSYYGPSYANIQSGWYRKTNDKKYKEDRIRVDKIWNEACDQIIISYVKEYGTYFTAFEDNIIEEIDDLLDTNLNDIINYYCYYISNRALEIEETRITWIKSHELEVRKQRKFNCKLCCSPQLYLECHPNTIRDQGLPPQYCTTCNYIVGKYSHFSNSIILRLRKFMKQAKNNRECEICNNNFNMGVNQFIFGENVDFADCIYPNLYFKICPKCFDGVFKDYKRGSQETRLKRLYNLYAFIDKIPTQNFVDLFYLCDNRESIIELLELIKKMRSSNGYKKEFGRVAHHLWWVSNTFSTPNHC